MIPTSSAEIATFARSTDVISMSGSIGIGGQGIKEIGPSVTWTSLFVI
jgi:hypothetical protein